VNLLLDHEAKIDVKSTKRETPLHLATKEDKKEIVQIFQERRPEQYKQIVSDIDTNQRDPPDGFTVTNDSVINANGEVDIIMWRKFMVAKPELFQKKNACFLVLAGIKGEKGKVGNPNPMFVEMSENQVPILTRKFENEIRENNIEIIVEDLGKHINDSELNEESLVNSIKEKHRREEKGPTVVILAFSWSKGSLIDQALQRSGLYDDLH
jgi:hypothetical protein